MRGFCNPNPQKSMGVGVTGLRGGLAESELRLGFGSHGWLSKLWSFFGYPKLGAVF